MNNKFKNGNHDFNEKRIKELINEVNDNNYKRKEKTRWKI